MNGLLILALVTGALLLGHFGVPVDATNYHAAAELHRSMARYRQLRQHDDAVVSIRNLLQVDEKIKDDVDSGGQVNSIDPDPEKHPDEFRPGLDVTEENFLQDDNPNKNPQHESIQEEQQVLDEKSHDNEVTTEEVTSRFPNLEKSVKEDMLGQNVVEKPEPFEENLSENQELENSVEKLNVGEKDDNVEPTSDVLSTDLDAEKPIKDDQLGQDVVERQEPAEANSRENEKDQNAEDQQLGKEEDMKFNEETLEEAVAEKPTGENSNENLELEQQQQEGSENDGELEQKETEEQQDKEEQKVGDEENQTEKTEPFVFPEPYLLGATIKDWDEQRAEWLEQNPHMKPTNGKPKVLIVTGSQPEPCRNIVGDFFHIQSLKLKMDYARIHNYEIYYSFTWLDPLFGGWWVKLPTVRKLMLTHPEIEWFFWIDSDALFTDMLFEPPFHTYEGYNMVMWGWEDGVYTKKLWTAFNAGVFIIRNCQWSLDLFDKWSPMGPEGPVRNEYGKILTAFLTGRDHFDSFPADDQSALVYLMITDEAVKSRVKLVERNEYMISGWWIDTVPLYNTSIEKYHPGFGDYRWPFITHFTGCSPCRGDQESDDYGTCMESFQIAYNFADNQVLAFMGFQHESLSSREVIRMRNETGQPLEFVGINPWEDRIAQVTSEAISGLS